MQRVTTIIFDLDGTIANTEPLWEASTRKMLEKRNKSLTHIEQHNLNKKIRGKCLFEGMLIVKELYDLEDHHHDLRTELLNHFDSIQHLVNYIPGCQEFIERVHQKYKIGIASNGSRKVVNQTVENLSLKQYFQDHIYSKDDVGGVAKPKPDVFLHAAKMLNSDPSECIVIEDSETGIEAAKKAGMYVIAINTSNMDDKLVCADVICHDYESVWNCLEKLILKNYNIKSLNQ